MLRIVLLLAAGLATTVVGAKWLFEATSPAGDETGLQPWGQDRMEVVAWNDQEWTVWVRESQFELEPKQEGTWTRHSNLTLAFVGWDGEKWQAKLDGDEFILAHRGDWQGPVERNHAIRYVDWQGRKQLRTVPQLRR